MATNTFRPTAMRTGVSTNVATTAITPTPDTGNSVYNAQTVYEWYDFSGQWKTNPPFTKGSAGSILPSLHTTSGSPRILRGFIRRAEYSLNDDASMSRLYMMYNPETISRDYLNYLDQGALDPFNTVFQSGNLVAPPSMLNFSFEMFFDRQEEAMAAGNRGVMVDMDYFDLVVRNVKPGGTVGTNNTLPDNGIMMVSPRDITVVFSPEITVQGRPLNASVTYERFTHRMVPTRVRINLQMRVVYFGPQREITTFVPETVRALESVPFPIEDPERYEFKYNALVFEGTNEIEGSDSLGGADSEEVDGVSPTSGAPIDDELDDVMIPIGDEATYIQLNMEAASHGWKRATERQGFFADDEGDHTTLQYGGIPRRMQLWQYCDCSSFIWACYAELGLSGSLGWEVWDHPRPDEDLATLYSQIVAGIPGNVVSTELMRTKFAVGNGRGRLLWGFPTQKNDGQLRLILDNCTSGDLLFRVNAPGHGSNHVGIIWRVHASSVEVLHAGSESRDIYKSTLANDDDISYNCAVRPYPKTS